MASLKRCPDCDFHTKSEHANFCFLHGVALVPAEEPTCEHAPDGCDNYCVECGVLTSQGKIRGHKAKEVQA